MQEGVSRETRRLQVVVGRVHFGVGAGLFTRPTASTAAGAELPLLNRLPAHRLHQEQQDRLAPARDSYESSHVIKYKGTVTAVNGSPSKTVFKLCHTSS